MQFLIYIYLHAGSVIPIMIRGVGTVAAAAVLAAVVSRPRKGWGSSKHLMRMRKFIISGRYEIVLDEAVAISREGAFFIESELVQVK